MDTLSFSVTAPKGRQQKKQKKKTGQTAWRQLQTAGPAVLKRIEDPFESQYFCSIKSSRCPLCSFTARHYSLVVMQAQIHRVLEVSVICER